MSKFRAERNSWSDKLREAKLKTAKEEAQARSKLNAVEADKKALVQNAHQKELNSKRTAGGGPQPEVPRRAAAYCCGPSSTPSPRNLRPSGTTGGPFGSALAALVWSWAFHPPPGMRQGQPPALPARASGKLQYYYIQYYVSRRAPAPSFASFASSSFTTPPPSP